MEWITPKTNWTGTEKATHNDFNRIERNIEYLSNYAEAPLLEPLKLDWDRSGYPLADEINRIEGNIKQIKEYNGFPNAFGWQSAKTNWQAGEPIKDTDMNRLEINALAVYEMVSSIKTNYKYCGTFTCGEADAV